ncbi:antitoxin Xre/MbcA/ParS-like domain-containing protein [Sphingopyxis solisilvae]|uniref:antitoxin Xre/MbcA/ParS-like domain-containing protein n=1 Tax=Sphingopyxis solisilvae TaxID=1886788 RepID=UPI001892B08D|nr:hypothetical protein [Sphingopyxis solisilvae]
MKQAHSAKLALTRAIENKVERMDMAGLLRLAQTLNVAIPTAAKAARGSDRRAQARPAQADANTLRGSGIGAVISAAEGGKRLDAITVDDEAADWIDSEVAGALDLVKRLKISRGTLDNWRNAKKVIALPKGIRNFVYPLRQFEERRPVPGIDVVARCFSTPEEAWEWLVLPNRMTGGKAPIESLRAGDIGTVAGAAEGALDYA